MSSTTVKATSHGSTVHAGDITQQESVLNWLRLEQLQRHATQKTVEFFKRRWLQYRQSPWNDCDATLGSQLQQQISRQAWCALGKIQRQHIIKRDTAHWDITTLTFLLTSVPKLLPSVNQDKQAELSRWNALRAFRNSMAHHPSKTFTVVEFEKQWNDIYSVLLWLGADADTLQQLKSSQQPGGVAVVPPVRPVDMTAEQKAHELRAAGNKAHEQQRYDEAMQLYSEGLLLARLSDNEYAKLLSNRSASYLPAHTVASRRVVVAAAKSSREGRQRGKRSVSRLVETTFPPWADPVPTAAARACNRFIQQSACSESWPSRER